ncbi:MAG: HlyD family efflux transporter periplasmic adaptor subunit [Saonia sp.]
MTRKLGIFFGLALLVLAVLIFIFLGNGTREEKVAANNTIASVNAVTEKVVLKSIPFRIKATGTLEAKEKIELFSEVQGVLQRTGIPFKAGNSFAKGQTIVRIDYGEHLAQLKSNKSSLVNQIAAMLPDMEVEFPNDAKKWETYLKNFHMEGSLEPLPEFSSDEERFFVVGKNITQTYYNVQNQQERLSKYAISAPFAGVLTEANVNVGALVRSGQKLGEFIDPSVFELRVLVPASDNEFLKGSKNVQLMALDGQTGYLGEIIRVNPRIDQQTQTIEVFIAVSDPQLKDGQYLKAEIQGKLIDEVYIVNSELLVNNENVYVIRDNALALQQVWPINYLGDSIMVKGLSNHQMLLSIPIPNAYPGMKINSNKLQ